ncbi:hypothetical protein P856_86 [Candidatus Endolissoclinum faulkneri L5]|uniref:DUF2852 domain-containing protein n=1 Tax=Candidatus Endolissoclinum faulkneri L5 TaxID=1401328 RepID=V9TT48_9PROT|nr:DUF2852 domain-containing protein [Candidatus Endolissoclinum faulkneri]AHC73327.1 hypothetical protein P856_86 [Candidatus Endolissoclinum faulkneri L5]
MEHVIMGLIYKLDKIGKLPLIGMMLAGFIFLWPIGLVIFCYMIWSGRMNCCNFINAQWSKFKNSDNGSSGNTAFDAYKTETLRQLEEEQQDFKKFLEQLRQSKDRTEFEQFMSQRRSSSAK